MVGISYVTASTSIITGTTSTCAIPVALLDTASDALPGVVKFHMLLWAVMAEVTLNA